LEKGTPKHPLRTLKSELSYESGFQIHFFVGVSKSHRNYSQNGLKIDKNCPHWSLWKRVGKQTTQSHQKGPAPALKALPNGIQISPKIVSKSLLRASGVQGAPPEGLGVPPLPQKSRKSIKNRPQQCDKSSMEKTCLQALRKKRR